MRFKTKTTSLTHLDEMVAEYGIFITLYMTFYFTVLRNWNRKPYWYKTNDFKGPLLPISLLSKIKRSCVYAMERDMIFK